MKKLAAIFSLFCAYALLVSVANGQDLIEYHYYDDEPREETTPLEEHSIVTPSGIVKLDALDFYNRGVMNLPSMLADVPTDPSRVSFLLTFDYLSPAMEQRVFDLPWSAPGLGLHSDVLPPGYYRNTEWTFKWMEGDLQRRQVVRSTAKLIIPAGVSKIPVYMYAGALNKGFVEGHERFIEMIDLRTTFKEMERKVSTILTNLKQGLDNNYGCPGWADFRFFGYIDGFEGGIDFNAEWQNLPVGLTIVPMVLTCGEDVNPEKILGCATLNGDRIVIAERVLTSRYVTELVILHELGHTKGLIHYDNEPRLVMNSLYNSAGHGILKEQCAGFGRGKEFLPQSPWKKTL